MSDDFSVDGHFERKSPIVREIYDGLIKKIKSFGEFQEEPHKTSIHLLHQTAFAGIATRKEFLLLTIKTDSAIENKRVAKTEKVSRNRFHILVKLESPKEIDAELLKWLKDSYTLSG